MYYIRNTDTGMWLNSDWESDHMWISTPELAGGKIIRDNWNFRLMNEHFSPDSPIEMIWIREDDGWENYCYSSYNRENEWFRECMIRRAKYRWYNSPELEGDDLFTLQQGDIKELAGLKAWVPALPTDSWKRYCKMGVM